MFARIDKAVTSGGQSPRLRRCAAGQLVHTEGRAGRIEDAACDAFACRNVKAAPQGRGSGFEEPTATLDAAVQAAINEWQMEASVRERDASIARLCGADEGLTPDEAMVERRAKEGGDGAEVAVQSA